MSCTPNPGGRCRFSSRRKTEAVLRLLRGEGLEPVSRKLGRAMAHRTPRLPDALTGPIGRMSQD